MRNRTRIAALLLFSTLVSLLALALSTNVYADGDGHSQTILNKSMLQALSKCISEGALENISSTASFYGPESLVQSEQPMTNFNKPIPNGYTSVRDSNLSCYTLVKGYYSGGTKVLDNVYFRYNHGVPAINHQSAEGVRKWLLGPGGYKEENAGEKSSTLNFKIAVNVLYHDGGIAKITRYTRAIYVTVDGNNKVTSVTAPFPGAADMWYSSNGGTPSDAWDWEIVAMSPTHGGLFGVINFTVHDADKKAIQADPSSGTITVSGTKISTTGKDVSVLINEIMTAVNKNYHEEKGKESNQLVWSQEYTCGSWTAFCYIGPENIVKTVSTEAATLYYDKVNNSDPLDKKIADLVGSAATDNGYTIKSAPAYDKYRSVAKLTGFSESAKDSDDMIKHAEEKMYLTRTEQVKLYQDYIRLLGANVTCDVAPEQAQYYKKIKWYQNGDKTITDDCYITNDSSVEKKWALHAVEEVSAGSRKSTSRDFYGQLSGTINYEKLVNFFNSDILNGLVLDSAASVDDPSQYDPRGNTEQQTAEDDSTSYNPTERSCYDAAGAGGWIACPIIENGSSASSTMYEFIEGMLKTNTLLFANNDGSTENNGTYAAWASFRDIANLIFIAIFIVVILSQITGYGIDNYGIKKILPKLILGALLINGSYFICQACVDIGNILGGGIKSLFEGIANGIQSGKEVALTLSSGETSTGIVSFSAAGILVAVISVAFVASGGGIIVPILLGVIGIVIAIVFFLILLAMRQALAVILVVISPVAFVMYMLPNTKNIFSKWLKIFSALLLAYPLCSLVIYGAQMASTVILMANHSNLILALTAAIAGIAPVFFIPSLITKSMSGISNISGRLQNRLTNTARGATERSRFARNMRDNADQIKKSRDYRSAGRTLKKLEGKPFNEMSAREKARFRRAGATASAYEKDEAALHARAAASMNEGDLEKMGLGALTEGKNGAESEFNAEQFNASLDQLFASGNDKMAWSVIGQVTSSKAFKNMSTADIEKFKNSMAKRGVIGAAYAKVLGQTGGKTSLEQAFDGAGGGLMGAALRDKDDNITDSMTKDDFEAIGAFTGLEAGRVLNDNQMAHGVGTLSGGKLNKFSDNILSHANGGSIYSHLTNDQWASAREEAINALRMGVSTKNAVNAERIESIINSNDAASAAKLTGARKEAYDNEMKKRNGTP